MYGWFYNSYTKTLNRYMEGDFPYLTIQFDCESDNFVLFENTKRNIVFLKNIEKKEGYLKLVAFGEIYLKDMYPDRNKLGAFYLDKISLLEDKFGYFNMD